MKKASTSAKTGTKLMKRPAHGTDALNSLVIPDKAQHRFEKAQIKDAHPGIERISG
jgi:hypothetical protein